MSNAPDWLTAIGTILVAMLAIWGEKVRDLMAGPKLVLEARNFRGEITKLNDGEDAIFYHLSVRNKRSWVPAKNVRILVAGILKQKSDLSYYREDVFVPQQLTWSPAEFHQISPTICKDDALDLGCLVKRGPFRLRTYLIPNNFKGYIEQKQAMRVELIISSDNFVSEKPYVYEISWDGFWSENLYEMEKHLVIKEIKNP